MKTYAVILAGGKGKRMKTGVSKQLIKIEGKYIINFTIEQFLKVDEIILVTNSDDEKVIKDIAKSYKEKDIKVVIGGKERYDSVYNALCYIENNLEKESKVLIHDGARPFVSEKLIQKVIDALDENYACVTGTKAINTYKLVKNGKVINTLKRDDLYSIQTPQGFRFETLKQAFEKGIKTKQMNDITDDGMVIEKFSDKEIVLIEGEYENIKITTKNDLKAFKKDCR